MPKEEEAGARRTSARGGASRLPGTWPAAAVTALSAVVFGAWAQAELTRPGDAAGAASTRLAEVAPGEIPAALDTLAISPEQIAQLLREREACKRRLAWVTVMLSPGQAGGRIRLQSGAYLSPAFTLSAAPVRVALPYPAPYPTGHGTISVLGTTADAVVALTPPWHVSAQEGLHAREVTWTPVGGCPGANP